MRSHHEGALPLLLTHGWPGSVAEFAKVMGPLADPPDPADAFHVVAPSLPGFGFSGKPTTPGWGVPRIADAWCALMSRLGYDRFVAHGGDWGAIITSRMGEVHADRLLGIHITMPLVDPEPGDADSDDPRVADAIAASKHYERTDSAYARSRPPSRRRSGTASPTHPPGRRVDPGEVPRVDRLRAS